MPGRFLTESERARRNRFPAEVLSADIDIYFTLSPTDLIEVRNHRGASNRLGFALQLCALRYLGFCPDDLTGAPLRVVTYVAQQLNIEPTRLTAYGQRAHTRTDHLQEIQTYLGYREATAPDWDDWAAWLTERALEHDKPTLLFQLIVEKLRADRIVRPGVTRLERLVATVRERAQQETFRRLAPLLTEERRAFLDQLLEYEDPPPAVPDWSGCGVRRRPIRRVPFERSWPSERS